jgi:hypothetical protein
MKRNSYRCIKWGARATLTLMVPLAIAIPLRIIYVNQTHRAAIGKFTWTHIRGTKFYREYTVLDFIAELTGNRVNLAPKWVPPCSEGEEDNQLYAR